MAVKKTAPPPPPPASDPEPAPPPPPPAWRAFFHPRTLAAAAFFVTIVVFGPRAWRALPDLNERAEYRLKLDAIEVTPPPRWLPADFVPIAMKDAGFPRDVSLLDDQLVNKTADAFRKHPWVAQVVRVEKTRTNGLKVELTYRQPVAVVEVTDGLYPVDRNGILLPPADLAPAEAVRFPRILNVTTRPQGPAGTEWGDLNVIGAARLASVLLENKHEGEPAWRRFDFAAIRVPRIRAAKPSIDDVGLEVITTAGSRIVWGRPPGSSHPGELSVDQKVGRLQKYVRDYGGFDRPHGPYLIDITHWQEISRSVIATGSQRNLR
ncbi:MAG: hypothetical protein IT428_11325 [Planctomycetaceae bacterium]|nr:hypothetical protein [Planctomycetaceae bacterium]